MQGNDLNPNEMSLPRAGVHHRPGQGRAAHRGFPLACRPAFCGAPEGTTGRRVKNPWSPHSTVYQTLRVIHAVVNCFTLGAPPCQKRADQHVS